MGALIFDRGDGNTVTSLLGDSPVLIGRGAAATIRMLDEFASRVHCEVTLRNGQVVLRDLDSHNGTLVNGQRIQEKILAPGDQLQIGLTQLTAQITQKPASPTAPVGQPSTPDFDVVLRVVPTAAQKPNPSETVRIALPPNIAPKT